MKGKCNCCKKATSVWLIHEKPTRRSKYGSAREVNFCDDCRPKEHYNLQHMQLIDGK